MVSDENTYAQITYLNFEIKVITINSWQSLMVYYIDKRTHSVLQTLLVLMNASQNSSLLDGMHT